MKIGQFKTIGFLVALGVAVNLLFTATTPALAQEAQSTSSYNWAGYVSTGQNFTSITGTWTVPSVANTNSISADATWVGIGGVKSTDLIQAGTLNQSGQYQAWYETLPDSIHPINLAVKATDSITVTLTQTSPNLWLINFQNNTTGQTYQANVQYNSSLSSAEWVQEMPTSNFGFIPLDNFGSVNFSNASATENGQSVNIAQSQALPMTMLNSSGQILAQASALNPDGASFSVTRTSATVSQGSTGFRFTRRRSSRVGVGIRGFTRHQNYTPLPQTQNYSSYQFFSNSTPFTFTFRF